MARRIDEEDEDWDEEPSDSDDSQPCPYCKRMIYHDAVRCPYCEQYLSEEEVTRSTPRWVAVTAVVCLVVTVLWILWGM